MAGPSRCLKTLGTDHPYSLPILLSLADSYQASKRVPDAIALFEQVRELRVKASGIDHSDTLNTLHSLAQAYRKAGRIPEAIALFDEWLARSRAKLGPDHHETLYGLSELVEALVRASGLQSHVRFLGEVVDVVPLLQQSDAFLMPSEIESFGLAALEAMSCGVPVVASNIGGLPEVMTHASTGFLHPVGDLDAMAQSTTQLLQDAALHRQMSLAARAACLERFELAPIADTWDLLYRRLLRNPT